RCLVGSEMCIRDSLKRALAAGDRLGGHLVTGHVDGVGTVVGREPVGDALRMTFEVPQALAPFLAPKGSITIDGTSLTVNGAAGRRFDVMLVPFTRKETLLDSLALHARVNLEVDVLAKYVARLLGKPGVDGIAPGEGGVSLDLLRTHGYL
ncbi:MAG: riboflavin synthase, partial [Candidatus Eisenbacteria bacterium]|nr:riboflavin synthase [Candidatus Eisenbacteria bacterium]